MRSKPIKVARLTLKVLLGLVLFFLFGKFAETQRGEFGVDQGNRLLLVQAAFVAAFIYILHLKRKGVNLRLLIAGGWLLLASVLGVLSWFTLPNNRLSRAIDRYYDLEASLEGYRLHQKGGSYHWEKTPDGGGELVFDSPDSPEVAARVTAWQRRELKARRLELEAAETRYGRGATRDSARETSVVFGVAGTIALGLAVVDLVSFRREKGIQAHNTSAQADG